MKQYKGVVFFDYDGTTVDEVDRIKTATPKTVESLKKLDENGYLTMLCSGRTKRFLEADIDKFQGAITCNGSYTEVAGEIIRDIFIPDELLFKVIDEYFPRDTIIQMDTQDVTYYLHNDAEFFSYFCRLFNLPDRWYAPWKYRKKEHHITKLVMNYKTQDVFEDFKKEFVNDFECAKKDSYAFGDADNDVEMMQAVGTGIAMGRHSDAVGEVASMVTGTVKEEGITQALEKLGLI